MKLLVTGSIAFYPQFKHLKTQLEELGHVVTIPAPSLDFTRDDEYVKDQRRQLLREQFTLTRYSEGLLVANYVRHGIQGYIGGSTLIEMGVAFYMKKAIFTLFEVSRDLSYYDEIMTMEPFMLQGDLKKVAR